MSPTRDLGLLVTLFISGIGAVILAALDFAGALPLGSAWSLLVGAGGISLLGYRTQGLLRDVHDMAERQEAELESLHVRIQEQSDSIDALADGLEIALFLCDARGVIQYANRRATELFRFQNPVGRNVLAVTLSHDLEGLLMQTVNSGETSSAEIRFTYPQERVGQVVAWTRSENPDRVFLSIYEITELRRLERIRTDFVANVSHELRTPMTIIRAKAEMMLDEDDPPPTPQASRALSKIIDEVDRLSLMTQDLLVLTAAESNPVRRMECDVADVVAGVVAQLSQKAADKNLELTYVGPDDLLLSANTAQMTQVAMNLIENAINYTNQGSVNVRLAADRSGVRLIVADSGIGIASEHLKRIFERFYRVDKARSRVTGGTGLGLSIVKHIVEAHGGTVSVDSSLGKGSEFQVWLPGRIDSQEPDPNIA